MCLFVFVLGFKQGSSSVDLRWRGDFSTTNKAILGACHHVGTSGCFGRIHSTAMVNDAWCRTGLKILIPFVYVFWIVCTRRGNIHFVLFLVPWSCRKPFALPVPKKWRLGRFAFDFDPIVEHWPRDSFTGHRKSRPSVVDGRLFCTQSGRQLHGWRDDIVIEDCLLCFFVGWLVFLIFGLSFSYLLRLCIFVVITLLSLSLLYNLPILFKILSIWADLFNFLPSQLCELISDIAFFHPFTYLLP